MVGRDGGAFWRQTFEHFTGAAWWDGIYELTLCDQSRTKDICYTVTHIFPSIYNYL
jgi:hypothetical protein